MPWRTIFRTWQKYEKVPSICFLETRQKQANVKIKSDQLYFFQKISIYFPKYLKLWHLQYETDEKDENIVNRHYYEKNLDFL
jgi:hypothetical protein